MSIIGPVTQKGENMAILIKCPQTMQGIHFRYRCHKCALEHPFNQIPINSLENGHRTLEIVRYECVTTEFQT